MLKWDPFALATHNELRLPRVVHHLAHLAFGLPALALHALAGCPAWAAVVLTLALSIANKFSWFDWHRTSGRLFHFPVPYNLASDPADFVSDIMMSQIVALAMLTPGGIARLLVAYYVLSTFNGT